MYTGVVIVATVRGLFLRLMKCGSLLALVLCAGNWLHCFWNLKHWMFSSMDDGDSMRCQRSTWRQNLAFCRLLLAVAVDMHSIYAVSKVSRKSSGHIPYRNLQTSIEIGLEARSSYKSPAFQLRVGNRSTISILFYNNNPTQPSTYSTSAPSPGPSKKHTAPS